MSFQQETGSSIHNLEKQIGQIASSVGKLEAQINGKLPSHALNPKENVSAIVLRSRKELGEHVYDSLSLEHLKTNIVIQLAYLPTWYDRRCPSED